ncbi:MAG TPA: GNAT family N-acetyltransferase, partial [Micromonosporaceae bacterium]
QIRPMSPEGYAGYTAEREHDTARALAELMPFERGLEEARLGTARLLPDGLATPGHCLLVAENGDGETIGHAWLGLENPRTHSSEAAYLYDVRVRGDHRRRGYANAMLAAIEEIARQAGATSIGLNVFARNAGAVALYVSRGFTVTTQQMSKPLQQRT